MIMIIFSYQCGLNRQTEIANVGTLYLGITYIGIQNEYNYGILFRRRACPSKRLPGRK